LSQAENNNPLKSRWDHISNHLARIFHTAPRLLNDSDQRFTFVIPADSMHQLRLLNVDDFMILRFLHEGISVTAIGQRMGLSQPAVTQRIRKMEEAFGQKILEKEGRGVRLTGDGERVARKAIKALTAFEGSYEIKGDEIRIGVRRDLAEGWVFPAVMMIREDHPGILPNIRPGSEEDLIGDLESGRLDAVITSHGSGKLAEIRGNGDGNSADVGLERHVFVASASLAPAIQGVDDLGQLVFIDRHSSLPSLNALPKKLREKLAFKSTWSVGSTQNVAKAVSDGLGCAIIPDFIATQLMQEGKAELIVPDIEIEETRIKLIANGSGPEEIQSRNHKYFQSLSSVLRRISVSQS
jgi:DNA-binding transcriptional LysR family regulator